VDITISDRVIYSDGTNSLIKGFNMNTNINDLFTLTDYESDTSSHRNTTKLARNAGLAFEMQALGLGGEVVDVAVKSSVVPVKVDLTDWANIIK
jgi:hypothetical protein